jgi:hypothetical protein
MCHHIPKVTVEVGPHASTPRRCCSAMKCPCRVLTRVSAAASVAQLQVMSDPTRGCRASMASIRQFEPLRRMTAVLSPLMAQRIDRAQNAQEVLRPAPPPRNRPAEERRCGAFSEAHICLCNETVQPIEVSRIWKSLIPALPRAADLDRAIAI